MKTAKALLVYPRVWTVCGINLRISQFDSSLPLIFLGK